MARQAHRVRLDQQQSEETGGSGLERERLNACCAWRGAASEGGEMNQSMWCAVSALSRQQADGKMIQCARSVGLPEWGDSDLRE